MSKTKLTMQRVDTKLEQTAKPAETTSTPTSLIRKLVLWTSTILGLGYILPNVATIMVLTYFLSEVTISSQENVVKMTGTILFLIASILLIALGVAIISGGIRFYKKVSCNEVIVGGVMLASLYLLCLGIGTVLLTPQIGPIDTLLVIGSVLVMVSTALHMTRSFSYKMIGALVGIASGISLAVAVFYLQPLKLAFTDWNVPFLGPFMSMALLEAILVILASVLVLVRSMSSERNSPVSSVLLSIIGMVYGISLFVGAFLLSFSFLNIIWKGPWLPPLVGKPGWVFSVVIFWSASLIMLEIGGFVLILLSCLGFVSAAKEFMAEQKQN